MAVAVLATWRLTHLLAEESGPWAIFVALRAMFGIEHDGDGKAVSWPTSGLGAAFGCVFCLSLWIAPIVLLLLIVAPVVAWILAASAGAIIIQEKVIQ